MLRYISFHEYGPQADHSAGILRRVHGRRAAGVRDGHHAARGTACHCVCARAGGLVCVRTCTGAPRAWVRAVACPCQRVPACMRPRVLKAASLTCCARCADCLGEPSVAAAVRAPLRAIRDRTGARVDPLARDSNLGRRRRPERHCRVVGAVPACPSYSCVADVTASAIRRLRWCSTDDPDRECRALAGGASRLIGSSF